MTSAAIPPSGISLHGAPNGTSKDRSALARSAVLLRLNEQLIADLRECSENGKALQLLSGKTPKIRYGAKTVDLHLSTETHRHELYTQSKKPSEYAFKAIVLQQADARTEIKKANDTAGADAALANLKQSLASFAQEKEAKKATISSAILPTGKNGKTSLHPHRSLIGGDSRAASRPDSPSLHSTTPHLGPTFAATSSLRMAAMRKALIHFLATGEATEKRIALVTHIPEESIKGMLPKVASMTKDGKYWELLERTYKELDVWNFPYKTSEDRQRAVNNAIRAFDRLRLSKDDRQWQRLLPKEERGKGKVLSRLHTGAAAQEHKMHADIAAANSPAHAPEAPAEEKTAESKGTPRLAASSTPRTGAAKGGVSIVSIEKRLKESKKLREVEEAKAQKQKAKEAAATNEKEPKPAPKTAKAVTAKVQPSKYKSSDVVHSSDDDDDDAAVKTKQQGLKSRPARMSDVASIRETSVKTKANTQSTALDKSPVTSKPKTAKPIRKESDSSDVPLKLDRGTNSTAKAARLSDVQGTASRKNLKPSDVAAGATPRPRDSSSLGITPSRRPEKHGVAATTAQDKLSPKKNGGLRVEAPSPLGVNAERGLSADSKKQAMAKGGKTNGHCPAAMSAHSATTGVAGKRTPAASVQPASSARKRPASGSDDDTARVHKAAKVAGKSDRQTTTQTDTETASNKIALAAPTDNGLKRKANDISSDTHMHDLSNARKHSRAESSSSQSATASSSVVTTTARTSVSHQSPTWQRSPSNRSAASDGLKLSWEQALDEAEKFRTQYYPAYIELYVKVEKAPDGAIKIEEQKKLFEMHNRLKQMKEEIRLAAE